MTIPLVCVSLFAGLVTLAKGSQNFLMNSISVRKTEYQETTFYRVVLPKWQKVTLFTGKPGTFRVLLNDKIN